MAEELPIPAPEKMISQSDNATNFTHTIFPDQLKKNEMEEMLRLLLKPEVEQEIARKEERLKEEEWKECEARVLGVEKKYEILKKHKEKLLPKGNRADSNAKGTRGRGGKDVPVTPAGKSVDEQSGLLKKRLQKARGVLSGNDSDRSRNTEIEFIDILGITDIDNISHVVDFMTGDDCPWMEYFLTEPHVLDDCKKTLVGLYETDQVRHAFVLKYNLAILTPLRAFLLKLLLKRRVWSIVETRILFYNMMKAIKYFVLPVPDVLEICELSVSILKNSMQGVDPSNQKDKFGNLYQLVKSWVNRSEIFGGHNDSEISDVDKEKETIQALYEKDVERYGFIVGDYMIKALITARNCLIPLMTVMISPPLGFAKFVLEVTGRAIRDLIYDVPEVTDIYLMADSIYKKKIDNSEEEVAFLRDKLRSWLLKTVNLKETLKSWLADGEVVKNKPKFSVPSDHWKQIWGLE
ncbi:hypothetical protein ACHQM5_000569 [Ranunculus cassubicifolius]